MIRLIEALSFRCLRDVSQEIDRFQILVGPNASGKSTFIDVPALLAALLRQPQDVVAVLHELSPTFDDLTFMREGRRFELAIEASIPDSLKATGKNGRDPKNGRIRYEIALGSDEQGSLGVQGENLWLKPDGPHVSSSRQQVFPAMRPPRETLLVPERKHSPEGWKKVVSKSASNDYFRAETTGWNAPFRFGAQRLALGNLPEDEERFPVAVWFRRLLSTGVQRLALHAEAIRRPSPPGRPAEFQPDGSNLPWAIERLRATPERFSRWLAHVRTALPDIEEIDTVEQEDNRHRYLRLTYRGGLRVPSWVVSDGTLRLLALTLVAYLDTKDRIFLIEEPENGIHPQAVETVYQALSGTYESQILCATHSPVMLSLAEPKDVLCFARTSEGATDIVRGNEHPNLRDWKRGTDLGTLFATGVLG